MNLPLLGMVFGIIFLAELPDKTALASLVLGTKYRPAHVFLGVAAAFAVHVLLAIMAGSLLGLLPYRVVEGIVAAVFLLGGVVMLRCREEDEQHDNLALSHGAGSGRDLATRARVRTAVGTGFWRVTTTSFVVLFVAEFGDLTQISIASLAARYHDPLTIGFGAVLGLWAVGALAITSGRHLLRLIPFAWIVRIAATVMTILAAISLINAVTG